MPKSGRKWISKSAQFFLNLFSISFFIPSILLAFRIIELTTASSSVISKSQRSCESGVNVQDRGHILRVHSHVYYPVFVNTE